MTRVSRPDDIRRHNLALLLGSVHRFGPLTRAELTVRLGLNRSTVGVLVAELCALGLLEECVPAAADREQPGPYLLQAQIAACHASAARPEDTDWAAIARLYAQLAILLPSPVVELNRAVAVSMDAGPAAGLALVDALVEEPALQRYHLLPSVRGELLSRLGRGGEARTEFLRAAGLARNTRERELLQRRARACEDAAG